MAQITNSSEECTCKDEVRVYKDEGEEEEEKNRSSENLSEDKVNLVTEGEDQKPLNFSDIFRPSYETVFQVPFADYFFPPYSGSYASAFSQDTSFTSKVPFMPPNPGSFGFMPFAMRDAMESCGLNGALGFPNGYPFQPRNGFMFGPHISALCSENLANMWASSNSQSFSLLNPFMSAVSSSTNNIVTTTSESGASKVTLISSTTTPSISSSLTTSATIKDSLNNNGMMYVPSPLRPTPINLTTYSPLSLKCSPGSKEATNTTEKWNESTTSNGIYPALQFLSNISVTSSTAPSTPSTTKYEKQPSFQNKESNKNQEAVPEDKFCKSNHHKESLKPHIKKPLNAFMLFMKEMRQKVQEECTLKESAAINQILGKKWHTLSREEQSKYYEIAKKEKQLHIQLFPDWSARDNYAIHSKHKKKRRLGQTGYSDNSDCKGNDNNNMKKCRARYGIEQMSQWCKPCRRKKKCIRFLKADDHSNDSRSKDSSSSTFRKAKDKSIYDMDIGAEKESYADDKKSYSSQAPSPQGPFLTDSNDLMTDIISDIPSSSHHTPHKKSPETSSSSFKPQLFEEISSKKTIAKKTPHESTSCASSNNTNNNTISELSSNLIPSPSSAFSSLKSSSVTLHQDKVTPNGCTPPKRHLNQVTLLI